MHTYTWQDCDCGNGDAHQVCWDCGATRSTPTPTLEERIAALEARFDELDRLKERLEEVSS